MLLQHFGLTFSFFPVLYWTPERPSAAAPAGPGLLPGPGPHRDAGVRVELPAPAGPRERLRRPEPPGAAPPLGAGWRLAAARGRRGGRPPWYEVTWPLAF